MALGALQLPGQINFKQLNPHIMLQSSPFVIQRQRAPWSLPKGGGSVQANGDDGHGGRPRYLAGMTCLGMGGTNVHMLIHEALAAPRESLAPPSMRVGVRRSPSRLSLVSNGASSNNEALSQPREDPQLIILSAHSATALARMCSNLKSYVEDVPPPDLTLANVALTLQRGRRQLTTHRLTNSTLNRLTNSRLAQ